MHLVDRHRLVEAVPLPARGHPFLVVPLIIEVPDDGGELRRDLIENRERIGLIHAVAVEARADVVLVKGPFADGRDETFPNAGLSSRMETVTALVPFIEFADDAYKIGVRRPHRKIRTRVTVLLHQAGAELFVEPEVAALVEKINIVVGDVTTGVVRFHQQTLPPALPS